MYTVILAARNSPESSVSASTLSHAKAIVNNFMQTHSKGARVRIEGPSGGTVFEFPEEKIVPAALKRWLETAAAKDKERLLAQLDEARAKPWKTKHRR